VQGKFLGETDEWALCERLVGHILKLRASRFADQPKERLLLRTLELESVQRFTRYIEFCPRGSQSLLNLAD
jgi:hypothetical protein